MKIDAHQHFWNYDARAYPWIQESWPIRRSFMPGDLQPLLSCCGMDGCVAVQARQNVEENRWLLDLAASRSFIAGVVGWVDLQSRSVEEQLARYAQEPKFVGVRHVVQDEPDDSFMLRNEFLRGLGKLREFDLAYDFLVFPRQLPAAIEVARRLPEQRFVLDHIAKPDIKAGRMEPWASHIKELAKAPNVWCKLSGMVTEARWEMWEMRDFQPYLDVVWEAFGPGRLMIGSDWPVCLLSGNYREIMGIVTDFLAQFSSEEQEKVMGANAIRFYRLPVEPC